MFTATGHCEYYIFLEEKVCSKSESGLDITQSPKDTSSHQNQAIAFLKCVFVYGVYDVCSMCACVCVYVNGPTCRSEHLGFLCLKFNLLEGDSHCCSALHLPGQLTHKVWRVSCLALLSHRRNMGVTKSKSGVMHRAIL